MKVVVATVSLDAHLVMARFLAGVADRGARLDRALALDGAGAREDRFEQRGLAALERAHQRDAPWTLRDPCRFVPCIPPSPAGSRTFPGPCHRIVAAESGLARAKRAAGAISPCRVDHQSRICGAQRRLFGEVARRRQPSRRKPCALYHSTCRAMSARSSRACGSMNVAVSTVAAGGRMAGIDIARDHGGGLVRFRVGDALAVAVAPQQGRGVVGTPWR